MSKLPLMESDRLLVGYESGDDAGVYLVDEETALIQTLDFITPVVDDPYIFGQIAAVNALSDVYAMGGKPLLVMNICSFPTCSLSKDHMVEIISGGLKKIREAEALLVGGHTVDGKELYYGLAVTGTVHPKKIITHGGAREGDVLILTKPLGTGIVNTAIKGEMADKKSIHEALDAMTRLNRLPPRLFEEAFVRAMTDVTGFGLLGHLSEMALNSGLTAYLDAGSVPVITGVDDLMNLGMIPAGAYRNRDSYAPRIDMKLADTENMPLLLFDPQTSGGLLISLPENMAEFMLKRLPKAGFYKSSVIGQFKSREEFDVVVES
jgi:selenide,water dikinase